MAEPPHLSYTERTPDGDPHPDAIHLPAPSVWPMVLAGAITLIAFGLLTSYVFTALAVALLVWALAGWIGELRHE